MKELICNSCGSKEFYKTPKKMTCKYCKSVLLLNKEKTEYVQKTGKNRVAMVVALLSVAIAVPFAAGVIGYLMDDNTQISADEMGSFGLENIDAIENWSTQLYESIIIATRHTEWTDGQTIVTYEGGSLIEDIEYIVGRPESTSSWEFEGVREVTATWRTDWQKDYSISVSITYIEDTGMIIRKDVWGFPR